MTIGLSTGWAILAFIVVIGPLILAHELGHFWAAKLFNIEVEEFGIGYPPRLLTLFERKGTKYTLNLLPMGGFMRPAGEDDPSVPGGLSAAPKLARFSVLAAGPAANFLVAFLLLVLMFLLGAPESMPGALVTGVVEGTPAGEAGLVVDDIILATDGIEIVQTDNLSTYIRSHTGEEVMLTILRGEETLEVPLVPRTEWPDDQGPMGIQMTAVYEVQQYGIFAATGRAVSEMGMLMKQFIEFPAMVIRQQIPARYLRPVSIIGISQMGGQAVEASIAENAAWPIVQLTAIISLALAVTNLLPIPALDGGRLFFILVEAIRGKRIKPEREMVIHFIGFALLIAAMAIFMVLDVVDPLVVP